MRVSTNSFPLIFPHPSFQCPSPSHGLSILVNKCSKSAPVKICFFFPIPCSFSPIQNIFMTFHLLFIVTLGPNFVLFTNLLFYSVVLWLSCSSFNASTFSPSLSLHRSASMLSPSCRFRSQTACPTSARSSPLLIPCAFEGEGCVSPLGPQVL